uniref:B box-type domain-containing protein n=1 Tax=Amphimedon queenslandica TaxID=400682 RepID=A0A1X7VGX1_AMPQE
MSSDTQPCQVPACSRHYEVIQEYCETCNELLCIQCLKAGHSTKHKISKYVDHLQNRKMDAEKLSQRIEHIKAQICNLQKLFQERKNKFCTGLQKTEEKINQSFQEVHKAMHDWEVRHSNILDRKNEIQLQRLEDAHQKGSKTVHIERPKVWIRTNARRNLHGIVKGLTPTLVLSISGATSYSRRSSHDSQLKRFEQLEYDYARPVGNGSRKGSRGKSISVTTPVRRYNPPPPSDINDDKSMLATGQANWGLSEEYEDLYYSEIVTNPPSRQIDNSCDDKVKYINISGLQLSPPSLSSIARPRLPAPPLQPPPPLLSYPEEISKSREQVNEYDMPPDPPTDSEYTSMDNIIIPHSLSPPPLPPRPVMVGTNKSVQEDYDLLPEEHAYQIFDPKMILLKPASIILNGLAATNPSESVILNDVCTGPLGSMIFTDQINFCVRILMTADEKPHKLAKEMRCQLEAVAYDQKNSRIIVASEKGLHQLEFDETKPNKAKNPRQFLKDNYCMSITSTKAIRGEETLIYAVTKKHGETFISCFKQNGQFVNKLDVTGKPCCIAYKDSYLVVATSQDKNLNKISTTGSPLWDIDVDARKKGVLFDPFRVVILPNDNIAVSEKKQHCISVFSKEGQHILRFGQFGDEPGMFNQPTGIAVRLEKELVVVDSGNKRIQIFALDELAKEFEAAVVEKERAEKEESDDDDNTIEL